MDDFDRRPAVLLRDRDRRAGFPSGRLQFGLRPIELLPFELLPSVELLQGQLLRSGPDLLCPRSDLLRSGSDLLCTGPGVLRSEALLRSQVLQAQVLQDAQDQVLQEPLLQAQLLRSGPQLLRSGPDVRCSLRSDVRRSRCCVLQLVSSSLRDSRPGYGRSGDHNPSLTTQPALAAYIDLFRRS